MHSHLDEFKENMGAQSDEHRERFHVGLRTTLPKAVQENMTRNLIWSLIRLSKK